MRSASTADLVKLASEQVSQLIRDELALARMEMQTKAKRMGLGAGLFGGAGVVVFYGVGALIAGIALLIALALPAWASALIVAGGLFLLAGLFALFGRSEVKRAGTPMPDEAIGSVKADVQTLSQAVKDGRA
ncbi:MAG TPA: phage holin family protein [Micromonosporaceae bacterium]